MMSADSRFVCKIVQAATTPTAYSRIANWDRRHSSRQEQFSTKMAESVEAKLTY